MSRDVGTLGALRSSVSCWAEATLSGGLFGLNVTSFFVPFCLSVPS